MKKAIQQLKRNKAEDGLFPENYYYKEDRLVMTLTKLFNNIWVTGSVTSLWTNDVIVEVSKKGNLR